MMAHDVTLFALSTCVHCRNTKEYLEEQLGQDGFECIYTDRLFGDQRNNVMRKLRAVNPDLSFPTIVIDGTPVLGFKKDKIDQLLDA